MEELKKGIIKYREKNSLNIDECAKVLGISEETLQAIENGTEYTLVDSDVARIKSLVEPKPSKGKRLIKALDLFFRFCAMVMSLVVVLLCINGYSDSNTMIALLAVGIACSSMTILPKIEK